MSDLDLFSLEGGCHASLARLQLLQLAKRPRAFANMLNGDADVALRGQIITELDVVGRMRCLERSDL